MHASKRNRMDNQRERNAMYSKYRGLKLRQLRVAQAKVNPNSIEYDVLAIRIKGELLGRTPVSV